MHTASLADALGMSHATFARMVESDDSHADVDQTTVTRNLSRMRDEKRNGKVRLISYKGDHDGGAPSWAEAYPSEDPSIRAKRIATLRRNAHRRWNVKLLLSRTRPDCIVSNVRVSHATRWVATLTNNAGSWQAVGGWHADGTALPY